MVLRFVTALLLSALVALVSASLALAQRGNPRMDFAGQSIDAMVANYMAENDVPGMALAIVQAPYIPRVTGYGVADVAKKLLVGSNTLFDVGEMANAYVAVAVMQLVEESKLTLVDPIGTHLPGLPEAWSSITLRDLLTHASGLPDFEKESGYDLARDYQLDALIALLGAKALAFAPGTAVAYSATDYVLLARAVEAASGQRLRDFARERQFEALGLRHTVFADEIERVKSELVELNDNRHKHFLAQAVFINPTERATEYRADRGNPIPALAARPFGRFGYGTILASAQDISIWDIGLAGGILVKDPALRAILYNPARLADGRTVPVMGDWRFPGRKGLMYITGSDNGHSAFLSRFTDPSELVCVTLLANKEGLDLSQLGRRIAGDYDPRLGPPDKKEVSLQQSPYPFDQTLQRFATVLRTDGFGVETVDQEHIRVAAGPGRMIEANVFQEDGQVWLGYRSANGDTSRTDKGLAERLDRALLRAVSPY